jgi:hypothetical protein
MAVAREVSPEVSKQWVDNAVMSFKNNGWAHNVVQPLSSQSILLMVTGEGRKKADTLG